MKHLARELKCIRELRERIEVLEEAFHGKTLPCGCNTKYTFCRKCEPDKFKNEPICPTCNDKKVVVVKNHAQFGVEYGPCPDCSKPKEFSGYMTETPGIPEEQESAGNAGDCSKPKDKKIEYSEELKNPAVKECQQDILNFHLEGMTPFYAAALASRLVLNARYSKPTTTPGTKPKCEHQWILHYRAKDYEQYKCLKCPEIFNGNPFKDPSEDCRDTS